MSAKNLAVGAALLTLLAAAVLRPAAADFVRLSLPQLEAALSVARAYGADRALLLYCLRHDADGLAEAYAGLETDLGDATDRLRVAGADGEQIARVIRAAFDRIVAPAPGRDDPKRDAQCAARDVSRELKERNGLALPLVRRPAFVEGGL